ncbi:MAG: TonB-dependent receptor [bacterium]
MSTSPYDFFFRRSFAALFALALFGIATAVEAQGAPAGTPARDTARVRGLDTIRVTGRIDDLVGTAGTASEGRIGAADLKLRPITREGELLESVPGVIVTQHSGEGKANQYFVRGFNLDHGTDFQTRLEGMPLNMPTHGHGQGYTDLNFLIPELVDHLSYKLGVYHAEVGDFGSAGATEFTLKSRFDHPFTSIAYGANGLARLAAGRSDPLGTGTLLVAGEGKEYNGPWDLPERVRKLSGVARYAWASGASQFSLLALGYHNQWNSNDQIPLRAVQDGTISRYGQLDTTDGGHSQRFSLSGTWRHLASSSTQLVQLFAIKSDLTLYSNFTYFLGNPIQGDQFSQTDDRVILGGEAVHTQSVHALGVDHTLRIGAQSRTDLINGVGLYHTQARVRFATVRQDDVRETGSGVYVESESHWTPTFRSVIGVRADGYTFRVNSNLDKNSGYRTAGIVSPKASLIFAPSATTEFYLSGGHGFHSNDARGTTIRVDPSTGDSASRVDPLVRSKGAEIGMRVSPIAGVRSTVSLWLLNLDSELLFTGDAGITEPSAASRRRGATFANFYRPIPELSIDADVSFSRARFVGVDAQQTNVPGALENVIASGVTYEPKVSGVFSSLRLRHFGSYPLIEDNTLRAPASNLVNADAGYLLHSGTRIQLSIINLMNGRADDIQYAYPSRLSGEVSDGVNDVHFHPVEPRQVRLAVDYKF